MILHWRIRTGSDSISSGLDSDWKISQSVHLWYGGHCYWIYAVCNVTIWRHVCVCKPTFWRSLLTQSQYYSTCPLLSHCCAMCWWNEHILSALQVTRPEKNTAVNTTTVQFIQ